MSWHSCLSVTRLGQHNVHGLLQRLVVSLGAMRQWAPLGEDKGARARPVSHSRQGAEETPTDGSRTEVSLPVTDHPVKLEEPWHEDVCSRGWSSLRLDIMGIQKQAVQCGLACSTWVRLAVVPLSSCCFFFFFNYFMLSGIAPTLNLIRKGNFTHSIYVLRCHEIFGIWWHQAASHWVC